METQSTHNTTKTDHTHATHTKTGGKENSQTSVFELLQGELRDPKEIRYSEYKELTQDQVEALYPKETNMEQNSIAQSLYIKVHFSDDEILNRVMFDKELEAMNNLEGEEKEAVQTAIEMDNKKFDMWSSFAYTQMAAQATMEHLATFAMTKEFAKDYTMEAYAFTFSKTMEMTIGGETRSVSYHTAITYTPETGIDRATLFGAYDSMTEQFKMIESNWHHDENTTFSKKAETITAYHDDIKNEYNKRVEENNSLLYYYTGTTNTTYGVYSPNQENHHHRDDRKGLAEHIAKRDAYFQSDRFLKNGWHLDFFDRREDHHDRKEHVERSDRQEYNYWNRDHDHRSKHHVTHADRRDSDHFNRDYHTRENRHSHRV